MIRLGPVGIALGLVAVCHGQPLLHREHPQPFNDPFGQSVAVIGDVNLDGLDDYVLGTPNDALNAGRAELRSGADGSILQLWIGTGPGTRLGSDVAAIGDVDGDTIPDVAIGILSWGAGVGAVEARSGVSGNLIWRFSGTTAGEGMGQRVASAGDVDLDGVPDVIGSSTAFLNGGSAGRVAVISGATGNSIYDKFGIANLLQAWGFDASSAGDIDGDAIPDLAVAATATLWTAGIGQGEIYFYSGANGAYIRTISATPGTRFGESIAPAGDVNGDGLGDLLVGEPLGPNLSLGVASLFSGATGSIIATFAGSNATGQAVAVGECTGDGIDDFVMSWTSPTGGGVRVFSGATLTEVSTFTSNYTLPTTLSVPGKTVVDVGGDVTGDGVPDILFGLTLSGSGQTDLISTSGARRYGTTTGSTLSLDFLVTANGATPGAITLTGGTPAGAGFLFASTAPATGVFAGLQVWIDIGSPALIVIPVTLDGSGAFSGLLDLGDPALAGTTLFGQGLSLSPAQATNGLQIRFYQ